MNFPLKAGIASAAVAVAALSAPGFAADLGGPRGGSLKDHGYQPMPVVSRGPAGPCYFRADVGYSHSMAPTVGFPTAVETNTTNIYSNGADSNGNPFEPTYERLYDRTVLANNATDVKIEDTWLGEAGVGCGSGSWGLRAEAVLGYRGDRKIDAQPGGGAGDFYTVRNIENDYRTTFATRTDEYGNTGDPLHTSLKTYTMMVNVYKDLGNYGGLTPYVGAGVGAAYHMLGDVWFTESANLHNRIKGDNDMSFAWSLMAGVGYQVSDRAILDFGYRYIDMGKAVSQRVDTAGFVNPRVVVDDITAHEFKIGLRYHFGSSDCCAQPVYAPMK